MAESRMQWVMMLWFVIGWAILIPASYIPYPLVRSIVATGAIFSMLPGMLLQMHVGKWRASEFKIWRATIRSQFDYGKRHKQQWVMRQSADPGLSQYDATALLPRRMVEAGWRQVELNLDKGHPAWHPEYRLKYKVYVRYKGQYRSRVVQGKGVAIWWGLPVPHNALDDVTLWEVPTGEDNCPIRDLNTQSFFPCYELREAPGDRIIEQEWKEQMRRQRFEAMKAAPVVGRR